MLLVLAMGSLSAADILTAKKKSKPLKAFHINLSWECMALPWFGSGIYASTHCKAGKFVGLDDKGELADKTSIPGWQPVEEKTKTPPFGFNFATKPNPNNNPNWQETDNKLVTSCTNTFLHKMLEWNKEKYDVITMVEMANPGEDGFKHLGREFTVPESVKGAAQQQVDPKIYDVLSNIVLKGYEVFGNVIKSKNIATQATYWKSSSLGKLTFGLGFNTVSGDDRPGSALFFAEKETLVLNIHGIHFRRNLNTNIDVFGSAGTSTMPDMASKIKADNSWVKLDPAQNPKFSMKEFSTDDLQKLYGDWLTAKMSYVLDECKKNDEIQKRENLHHDDGFVDDDKKIYCQGTPKTDFFSEKDGKLVLKTSWKIIVAGDFNDETMELSKFKVFGVEVSVKPEDRKRTTSSDMDRDFQAAFDGEDCKAADERSKVKNNPQMAAPFDTTGAMVAVHTTKTTNYLGTGGYFPTVEDYYAWLDTEDGAPHNPMKLKSALKVMTDGEEVFSAYPFPSDMILGSANLHESPIEFPLEYKQKMSKGGRKGYEEDPIMPGEHKDAAKYFDGMISDHDPIQRTFTLDA